MRIKALRREEREILVINWFQIRIQHDNEDYASMYEIARGLGMSPSSHLTNILSGMVEKGILDDRPLSKNGRFESSRGYMLKKGTFKRIPKQPRSITINSSKGQTQMELF